MSRAGILTSSMIVPCVLVTAGCAISFTADHVPRDKLTPDMSQNPGIYYALPKTEIALELTLDYQVFSGGELGGIEACERLWNAGLKPPGESCKVEIKLPTLTLRAPSVATRPVVDYDHVYKVTPETSSPFKSVQFDFDYGDLGYLTGGGTRGQNDTGKVLLSVAASVAKSLWSSRGFDGTALAIQNQAKSTKPPLRPRPPPPAAADPYCGLHPNGAGTPDPAGAEGDKVAAVIDRRLADRTLTTLTRAQVQCVLSLVEPLAKPEPPLSDALRSVRRQGEDVAQAWLTQRQKEIDAAKAELALRRNALHIDAPRAALPETRKLLLAKPLVPAEAASAARAIGGLDSANATELCEAGGTDEKGRVPPPAAPWCVIKGDAWRGLPDADGVEVDPKVGAIFTKGRRILVRLSAPPELQAAVANAPDADAAATGYRYRLPAAGRIDIRQLELPDGGSLADCGAGAAGKACTSTRVSSTVQPIAQFGPIAALPKDFKGTDAFVKFTLGPTGALKTISLGQKAQSGSEITSALSTLQDARTKARDAQTVADTAAQGAPLAALKNQVDLARYQQCLDALKGPPADGSKPAICP